MDDMLFVQAILFFYLINMRRQVSTKQAPSNSRWTWITCYFKSNQVSICSKVRYDYPSIPHSHTMQPLDVNCFKPFKSIFRKERNESMFKNNHREPDKVTLAGLVDRTFNRSLSKQNIKARFKTIGIWPLNSRAMDNQSRPSELYTTKLDMDISNDEDG